MTAPYAPTLLSPVGGIGAKVDTLEIRFRYNAPTSQPAGGYWLSRRQLSPTTGSWEYYTDSLTWVSPVTKRSAIANVQDADEVSVTVSGTWGSTDTVWEWRMQFENDTAEQGPVSNPAVFVPRPGLVLELDVEDPSSDGRPYIRWILPVSGVFTIKQQAFQMAVYQQSIVEDLDFDPDSEVWQQLAEWFMSEEEVSGTTFRKRVGVDLAPGQSYYAVGRFRDQYGVLTPWTWNAGLPFDVTYTRLPAPNVTTNPLPSEGVMEVEIDSAFNIADEDSSAFVSGVGQWTNDYNCFIGHDVSKEEGIVTVSGSTYAVEDSSHGTYANADTAHGTYENQRTFQETNAGLAKIHYKDPYTDYIPATPSQDYSAVISVKPISKAVSVRVDLEQFTSGGASAGAAHTGSWVACPQGVWTPVGSGTFSISGTAAYLRPAVVFGGPTATAVSGDVYRVDNFAVARSSEVAWSPGGGELDVKFTLARKIGDGDWEYVWDATRENPKDSLSGALTFTTIRDRAYPCGTSETVMYRAVALSDSTGKTITSDITTINAPSMECDKWFLRSVSGLLSDVRLRAMDFEFSVGTSSRVMNLQGQSYSTISESGDAPSREVNVRAWLFDPEEYQGCLDLLASKSLLYVQRNVGDGFYIWPTGTSRVSQRRARSTGATPKHLHTVDFRAEILGPPKELFS